MKIHIVTDDHQTMRKMLFDLLDKLPALVARREKLVSIKEHSTRVQFPGLEIYITEAGEDMICGTPCKPEDYVLLDAASISPQKATTIIESLAIIRTELSS